MPRKTPPLQIERNPSAYVPVPEGGESWDAGYIQDGAPIACSGLAPAAIARTRSGGTGTAALGRRAEGRDRRADPERVLDRRGDRRPGAVDAALAGPLHAEQVARRRGV